MRGQPFGDMYTRLTSLLLAGFDRLFLHVFRLLTQKERKVLTVEDREGQLARPTLSAIDHATLAWLKDMM
jgi:hypothetical protein